MAAVVVIAGAIAVGRWIRPDTTGSRHPRTAVAVLPFQNLSAGDANAYFAGGLHDEVLTQLSKVATLKVISRTSVMGYEGKDTPLRQIATELGVGSVVEGSVQVVGERLRVNVQLIDAATDEHHFDLPDCIYRTDLEGRRLYAFESAIFGSVHPQEAILVEDLSRQLLELLPEGARLVSPLSLGGHIDHRLDLPAVGLPFPVPFNA